MRIELHNQRRHVGAVEVDPDRPPYVVHVRDREGAVSEHYLEWERVLDDEGHLRRCPVCGCEELYKRSACPPLNGFIIVLLFGLASLSLWGLSAAPLWLVLGMLAAVTVVNVLGSLFAPRFLVCYRCRSSFHGVWISQDRREWDAATAEKYEPRTPTERGLVPQAANVLRWRAAAGEPERQE